MNERQRVVAGSVLIGLLGLAHAAFTWPASAMVTFFGGGATVAFVAEAAVGSLGWVEHHVGRRVAGVPLYVLLAWPGTVYVAFRRAPPG